MRLHRNKVADSFNKHDFILNHVLENLASRLTYTNKNFHNILNLGAFDGRLAKFLPQKINLNNIIYSDISEKMLQHVNGMKVVADEESLPFKANSFDLIISPLVLHKINNPFMTMQQIYQNLQSNGLFLGAIFGGETIKEFKDILNKAYIELNYVITPRIYPFTNIKDITALMQQIGFNFLVADTETIEVEYSSLKNFFYDLKGMNENNFLTQSSRSIFSHKLMEKISNLYNHKYSHSKKSEEQIDYSNSISSINPKQTEEENKFIIKFEIIYITAMK